MDDETKKQPTPEEIQDQLKTFFKDKFGGQVILQPMMGGQSTPSPDASKDEGPRELEFDQNPRQVKAHLDDYVIGQEEAKKILSVAVCDHYNHVKRVLKDPKEAEEEYVKQNVILLGPTGVGKTYLIRTLAHLIGVPFVKADITKFSETGYVGGDVDDLVRELVRNADGDVALAECGIIFLDEIDKIAAAAEPLGRDVSGRGVQTGLLKLLEETEVPSRSPFDMAAQMRDMMQMSRGGKSRKNTINTKHILFVVSGAFTTLPQIITKRLSASQVGFGSAPQEERAETEVLKEAATRDFIDYGFEPEFIGRLPIRVALSDLREEDLYNILKHSRGSIIKQYRRNFEDYGIDIAFMDDALRAVAERAIKENTGARGLMTVLESILRDFKFHLPGTDVKRFAMSRELVDDPDAALEGLRKDPNYWAGPFMEAQVREFETAFYEEHDLEIAFDASAVKKAIELATAHKARIPDYLEQAFMDYVYGLRIIREHTDKTRFVLTEENLADPRKVLDKWVKDALNETGDG